VRDIFDGMTSVECRHANFSSYVQISANRSLPPVHIFVSLKPCHSFAEPSLRNAGVEEQTIIEKYLTNFRPRTKPAVWRIQGTSVTTFRYYFNFSHVQGKTWRKTQGRNILLLYWSCLGWKYWWNAFGPRSDNSVATFHSSAHLPLQYQCIYLVMLCVHDVSR